MANENDYKIVTTTGALISSDINVTVSAATITLNDVNAHYANVDLLSKINDLETRLKALEEAYMELMLLGKSE